MNSTTQDWIDDARAEIAEWNRAVMDRDLAEDSAVLAADRRELMLERAA